MQENYKYRFASHRPTYNQYHPMYAGKKTKARYYVWMFSSFSFIIFISVISGFVERCRQNLVFQSQSFKLAALGFITFIACSFLALRKAKEYKDHIYIHIWREQRLLSVIIINLGVFSTSLFAISLIPAYHAAALVFFCLGGIFLMNIACIILYD